MELFAQFLLLLRRWRSKHRQLITVTARLPKRTGRCCKRQSFNPTRLFYEAAMLPLHLKLILPVLPRRCTAFIQILAHFNNFVRPFKSAAARNVVERSKEILGLGTMDPQPQISGTTRVKHKFEYMTHNYNHVL